MKQKVLFSLIVAVISVVSSQAAEIFVDTSNTSSKPDGKSWATAFADLQKALTEAEPENVICLAEGVYYPAEKGDQDGAFFIPAGVTLLGGFPSGGGPRNVLANQTILSGDIDENDTGPVAFAPSFIMGDNSYHVIVVEDKDVTLDGLVITAGSANGSGTSRRRGAALVSSGADLTVRDCLVIGNQAQNSGGAFFLNRSAKIVNTSFTANQTNGGGGALALSSAGSVELINAVFLGNAGDSGAAILASQDELSLVNVSMSGNAATTNGGAIRIDNGAALTISNSVIWKNSEAGSTSASGASISVGTGSQVITNSNIDNDGGVDPLFVDEPDPADAPSSVGDLDLILASPLTNAGASGVNSEILDILGRSRIGGFSIDIGAFELSNTLFVDAAASGSENGVSWNNAFTKLNDALAVANSASNIFVARGVYYTDEGAGVTNNDRGSTFSIPNGARLEGGYPTGGGVRNVEANVTILSGDLQKNDVNLDGNFIAEDVAQVTGDSAIHIVTANGQAALSGFTLTAGVADDDVNPGGDEGSGVFGENVELTISDCTFQALQTRTSGSLGEGNAISIEGDLALFSCQFLGNRQYGGDANIDGGVCAITGAESQVTISSCVFRDNFADLDNAGSSNLTGTLIYVDSSDGTCRVTDTVFEENIEAATNSTLILMSNLELATFDRCRFRGNTHEDLFDIRNVSVSLVNNCLITGNEIEGSVFLYTSDTALSVLNCTISGNDRLNQLARVIAPSSTGTLVFANTVSKDVNLGSQTGANITVFRSNSLIQGTSTDPVNGNLDGASDPGFVDPKSRFDAPTLEGDYRLLSSSPLIDAGLNTANNAVVDLDGGPRIQDGDNNGTATIDVGAYEMEFVAVNTEIEITSISYNSSNGQLTLTVEADAATNYTSEFNDDLAGTWDDGPDGSLSAGTNTVVIPGSVYSWPKPKTFVRLVGQ